MGLWESSARAREGDARAGVVAGDGPCPSPFPASCPSLGQSSPVSSGQPWPRAVGPALLCCSRDPKCQFQKVPGASGSFPAVRLCNSYWSREVWGREHGGPEDMAGWPGGLHSLLYITEDPTGV